MSLCLPRWHSAGRGTPETGFSARSGCFLAGRPRGLKSRPAGLTHLRSGRLVLRQPLVVGTASPLLGNAVQSTTMCKT